MQQVLRGKVIPMAIEIDREELKRLKAYKLISLDLYIWWALTLTFGETKTDLDIGKLDIFCERWSLDCGDYIEGSKVSFQLTAQDVLIAIGKLSKKQGTGVKVAVQLSLDLGVE